MKSKKIIAVWAALVMVLGMVGCGGDSPNRPLNERGLADIIPENILSYSLDGETRIMSVNSITIDRRQTIDKVDTVYTVIEMSDEYVRRTAYYKFTINFYDVGGWMIDEQEQYQDTTAIPLKIPSGLEDKAADVMSERQINNFNMLSINQNIEEGTVNFIFDIQDTQLYLTHSGTFNIEYSFRSVGEGFSWIRTSWHQNDLITSLNRSNLVGEWSGEIGDYWAVYLFIEDVTDTTIHVSGVLYSREFIHRNFDSSPFNNIVEYNYDIGTNLVSVQGLSHVMATFQITGDSVNWAWQAELYKVS
jgi:hypothetical protein